MNNNIKMDLKRSKLEVIMNTIGISVFLITCIYLFVSYGNLPERVPTSVDVDGNEIMGDKLDILFIPFGAVLFWMAFNFVERQAHWHSYPERMNEENREAFYRNSIHMMNMIKNAMLVVVSILIINTVSIASGDGGFIPTNIFMFIIFIVMAAPIVWSLSNRSKIN